jgi:ketosteroid isomerase-like protein
MQATDKQWSSQEEKIAQEAFNKAYEREIAALIQEVEQQAKEVEAAGDLWRLHDLLSAKRHEIDGKYHYDTSTLLFILAELVQGGWLKLQELEGLEKDKVSKIKALTLI